jgi:hypothetical protein
MLEIKRGLEAHTEARMAAVTASGAANHSPWIDTPKRNPDAPTLSRGKLLNEQALQASVPATQ